jgi:hypothetical protein
MTFPATTPQRVATSWGASGALAALNGASSAITGFDGDLSLGANFAIGGNVSAAAELNGTIRNVRLYAQQLPASTLVSMTTP